MSTDTHYYIRDQLWVAPIKQDDAAKDTPLGPVTDALRITFRVLVVGVIPWVAGESGQICGKLELLVLFRGAPPAESVVLVSVSPTLSVEPNGDLVNPPGHELDQPGGKAWKSQGVDSQARRSLERDCQLGTRKA